MDMQHLAVAGVVFLGGFVRGVTGFGGAMVMAPPLSIILGPVQAVVISLLLETAGAFVMFPSALAVVNWRVLAFLTIPAAFTIPIGGYALLNLDPYIARKFIAIVVMCFSAMLLSGVRYTGSPRPATSIGLGSLVGAMLGATGVGAPPVILYLLSGSDPQRVTRANLTVFVTLISILGLVMLAVAGAISSAFLIYAALLAIPFMLATWAGGLLFERMTETGVRRFALVFIFFIGLAGVLI